MIIRLLLNFIASIFIAIAGLAVALVVFLAWAAVDQSITERRARAFCDAFTVGAVTSRDQIQERLKDKRYRVLLIEEDYVLVTFPTHLPSYYGCGLYLDDWKVIDKDFEFKD